MFREAWGAIGDSIVVVGGDGLWNCHIHTNEIGGAIEAGIDAGRPRNIRVTDLFEQVDEERWVREAEVLADLERRARGHTAVVAVGVGEGVRRLLTSLGVQQVVAGGQSMNPSTAQILEAVEACNADAVIVLPNNKNIVPVAQQVDALTGKHVAVVADDARDRGAGGARGVRPQRVGRRRTARRCRTRSDASGTGEVTQAVRDAVVDGADGARRRLDRDRRATGSSRRSARPATRCASCSSELVDDDSEIVTVLVGADAPANETQRIREHSSSRSRTSRSSSTTAASRSTRISSGWSNAACRRVTRR